MTVLARTRAAAFLSVLVPLFALYAATACRTVGAGDSGELTVVMSTWGVAHAPGYPLMSLIGNLVSLVPFPGEPAFPLNLMTALFAALAAAVLALAVIEATGSIVAGVIAGLALGTSRVYWEYALVVEVFALNSLFGALLLYFLARFLRGLTERKPVLWPLPAAALTASTAITHHLTLVLVAIPVLIAFAAAIFDDRSSRPLSAGRRRAILLSIVAGIAGLLPLLYIPLAARGNPVLNWDDPTTTGNIVRLLKREDFGSGTLMNPWLVAQTIMDKGPSVSPLGARHLKLYFAELPRNFGWAFIIFPLVGLAWSVRRSRNLAFFFAPFGALLVIFFLRVNSPVIPIFQGVTERFYILPNVVVAFAGGIGIAWALDAIRSRSGGAGGAAAIAAAALLALTAIAMAFVNGPHVSMRNNTFTRDFGANFIEGMPPNAIVLSEGDLYHNAFYYQQACLGKRPDLEFIDEQKLTYPWYVDQVRRRGRMKLPESMRAYTADASTQIRTWLDLNLKQDGRPVVAVTARDESWSEDYRLVPMGLWWRFWPRDQVPPVPAQAQTFEAIANQWNLASLDRTYHERSWEEANRQIYPRAIALLAGVVDLAEDLASGKANVDPDPAAARWLERAFQLSPGDRGAVTAGHLEIFHRALAERSIDLAPAGGPGPILAKTIALAQRALQEDPANIDALKILAALMQAPASGFNAADELEVRGRIVDLAPGDVNELAAYVQLAINLMSDPARRSPAIRDAMIRREQAFLSRLELAIRVSNDPSLAHQRNQWQDYLRKTESMPG